MSTQPSPLLTGMAAAVIHAHGTLPDTRPKLYAALVGLFETSRGSTVALPGTKALATRVLDGLGWLLMHNPLATADQVVERLAELLASPLGITPLAATEKVDALLNYWEQLGIIERLHHDGLAYWTFVHRSFTEFGAARHLMALPDHERARELDRLVDEPDWHEVVAFAGGLGLSDEIARLFVARRAAGHPGQMERALKLAADRDAAVSVEQVRELGELAFNMIEAGEEDRFAIGVALVELAKAHRAAIVPQAKARRDDPQPAVQLVAWACLAAAAPTEQDDVELTRRLEAFLPMISSYTRTTLLGGFRFGGRKDRELVEEVALAALNAQPTENLTTFVETHLTHEALDTGSFQCKVEIVLRVRGVGDKLDLPWHRAAARSIIDILKPDDEWRVASHRAMGALARAAMADDGAPIAENGQMRFPQFAALYAISNYGNAPAYDVHLWKTPFDPNAMRTIIQAIAQASAIDPYALSQEAAAALGQMEDKDSIKTFGFDLPDVDVPEPDWANAASLIPDRAILVAALNHGSEWLAYLAGNLLAALPTTEDQSRALLDGRGSSLWIATAVVREQQPNHVANALIVDRLAGPLPNGAESLFRALEIGAVDNSPEVSQAIRNGLESPYERVAEAAASLAKTLSERGQPVAAAVLTESYDRWTSAETGTRDGVIPPTPRVILFKLLVAQDGLGDDRLLAALSDKRTDISTAGVEHLPKALAGSPSLREAVATEIAARSLSPRIALIILDAQPPFTAAQKASFESLLTGSDPRWRRVGVGLLRSHYLNAEKIVTYRETLGGDDVEEIREEAARPTKSGDA